MRKIQHMTQSARAALLLALLFTSCSNPLRRTEGSTFDSGGTPIHYTDEGEGPAVILVHGLAVNADLNWRRNGNIARLVRQFRVIALDLRGHGLSGKPHEAESYGVEMAEDILRLMDYLGISRTHMAGYSLGGKVALKFATMYPERLLTLAVLGFGHGAVADMGYLELIAQDLENGKGMPPLVARLSGNNSGKPSLRHTLTVRLATRFLSDGRALAGVIRGLPQLAISKEALEELGLPCLTVVGELDPIRQYAETMCDCISDCTMIVIEGADHIKTVNAEQVGDTLIRFWRRHGGM